MRVRLEIELDYDADTMHGNTPDGISWFESLLFDQDGDELILHHNEIGDTIGTVKVIKVIE